MSADEAIPAAGPARASWLDDGLAGARVLVTGAGGGIGRAVAEAFVAVGAEVVGSDLDATGLPGTGIAADLRPPGAAGRLVEESAAHLGGLDVVAHFAGVIRRRTSPMEVTEEDWDVQHDVNLKATFFLLRAAAESMRARGRGGRLIAATSQGWWSGGYGGSAVYAASKGGVVSLCRGLARTYGADGITVNTIAPGAIDTAMLQDDVSGDARSGIVEATPLGRLGTPEDVAGTALFLASSRAAFVSAATINVSGGWLVY